MHLTGKRSAIAAVATVALLVGAGTAVAATQAGPQKSPPRYGLANGGGGGVQAGGVVIDAAAAYLGIGEADLVALRHDGASLAQIAADRGKSLTGLKDALVTAFDANLDKAVAAGRITEAQAAQALATFKARIDTVVSRTDVGPVNGRGGGRGHGGGAGMGMGLGTCRA